MTEQTVDAAADPDEGKTDQQLWDEVLKEREGENAVTPHAEATDEPDSPETPATEAGDSTDTSGESPAKELNSAGDDSDDGKGAGGKDTAGSSAAPAPNTTPAPAPKRLTLEEHLASAPPEIRAEIENLRHSERSNRQRVSQLQRKYESPAPRGASPSAPAAPPKPVDGYLATESWKKFRSEYPEVAGPLAEVVGSLQAQLADQQRVIDAVGSRQVNEDIVEQEESLGEAHPDWQTVASDPSYGVFEGPDGKPAIRPGSWISTQPRHVREAALRNAVAIVDAEEAADVVGRFKAFRSNGQAHAHQDPSPTPAPPADSGSGKTGSLSDRRRRQLAASSSARTSGPGVALALPDENDEAAAWKYFDELHRRKTERRA